MPQPLTTRVRSNPSSSNLCSAVSTLRATTCTVPARLAVGAKSSVSCDGCTRHWAAIWACSSSGGGSRVSKHSHGHRCRLAARNLVEQCLLAGGGPHGAGTHCKVFAGRDLPARILRGHARRDRLIGADRDRGPRPDFARCRHNCHTTEPGKADFGQSPTGFDASPSRGAAVEQSHTGRASPNFDAQAGGIAFQLIAALQGQLVEHFDVRPEFRVVGSWGGLIFGLPGGISLCFEHPRRNYNSATPYAPRDRPVTMGLLRLNLQSCRRIDRCLA